MKLSIDIISLILWVLLLFIIERKVRGMIFSSFKIFFILYLLSRYITLSCGCIILLSLTINIVSKYMLFKSGTAKSTRFRTSKLEIIVFTFLIYLTMPLYNSLMLDIKVKNSSLGILLVSAHILQIERLFLSQFFMMLSISFL